MKISYKSQLGLRFKDQSVKIDFLKLMKSYLQDELGLNEKNLNAIVEASNKLETIKSKVEAISDEEFDFVSSEYEAMITEVENNIPKSVNEAKVRAHIHSSLSNNNLILINDEGTKYYYICESVYKAAELIRIGENFSGRALKDIKTGSYTYLMGAHAMVRFICDRGVIMGLYYNDLKNIGFEFGLEFEDGGYYYSHERQKEFSQIMQIMTFIELGDIQVKYLEAGRNNGAPKNSGKITNTSEKNVYIVDSNWNTLVIRTDGFAVRGHFRLQAHGEGLKDRKLIWIDAFEKHGYKRRPTGEIVH